MEPQANAVNNPAAPAVAAPVVAYGIDHIKQIFDVAVQGVADYKSIQPSDGTMQKVLHFMPSVMKLAGAIDAIGKAGPEFSDLSPDEVKQLADAYMPQFGLGSGKTAVYVEEGVKILISGFKIFKAK